MAAADSADSRVEAVGRERTVGRHADGARILSQILRGFPAEKPRVAMPSVRGLRAASIAAEFQLKTEMASRHNHVHFSRHNLGIIGTQSYCRKVAH